MKASIPIKISAASSPESEDPIMQTSSSLSKSFSSRSFHSSQSIGDGRKKINLVWDTLTPSTSTDSLDVSEKWKTLVKSLPSSGTPKSNSQKNTPEIRQRGTTGSFDTAACISDDCCISLVDRRSFDTNDIGSSRSLIHGKRLRNLFHRTYFVERQKQLRGERAQHPVFDSDIRRPGSKQNLDILEHTHTVHEKKWEKQFAKFLDLVVDNIDDPTGAVMQSRRNLSKADECSVEKSVYNGQAFVGIDWTASKSLSSLDLMVRVIKANMSDEFDRKIDEVKGSYGVFAFSEHVREARKVPTPEIIAQNLKTHINEAETLLRTSFTQFHNEHVDNSSVFLGEVSSMKDVSAYFKDRFSLSGGVLSSDEVSELAGTEKRVPKAVLSRLPAQSDDLGHGLTEALAAINSESWMLPYILRHTKAKLIETVLFAAASRADIGTSIQYKSMALPPTESNPRPHSSWCCIGNILVTRNRDASDWQMRTLYICDNYLLEATQSRNSVAPNAYKLLGTANLAGGVCTVEQTSSGIKLLKVSYYPTTAKNFSKDIWLQTGREEDILTMASELSMRTDLRLEDIYYFVHGPEGKLGEGQCNEVLLAKRKTKTFTFMTEIIELNSGQPDAPLAQSQMFQSASAPLEKPYYKLLSRTPPTSPTRDMSCRNLAEVKEKAKTKGISDRYCALKIISKDLFWGRVAHGKERADSIVREVLAQAAVCLRGMQRLDKDNIPIVKIFNVFETTDCFVIEMELMESSDLFDKLAKDGILKENTVKDIVLQLLDAIQLCSWCNIAHRDVKLQNITFPIGFKGDEEGSRVLVKLADFGMAGFAGTDQLIRGRCGTPGYVAPEILHASVHEGYNLNVDIFSLGVVAYTLLCGYEPFYGTDDAELIKANKLIDFEFHSPEWDRISANAKSWISKVLVTSDKRLTPEQALRHAWLTK